MSHLVLALSCPLDLFDRLPKVEIARGEGVCVNKLFYGDSLEVLQDRSVFPDECVDLIYLDPPFNSDFGHYVLSVSAGGDSACSFPGNDSHQWL